MLASSTPKSSSGSTLAKTGRKKAITPERQSCARSRTSRMTIWRGGVSHAAIAGDLESLGNGSGGAPNARWRLAGRVRKRRSRAAKLVTEGRILRYLREPWQSDPRRMGQPPPATAKACGVTGSAIIASSRPSGTIACRPPRRTGHRREIYR